MLSQPLRLARPAMAVGAALLALLVLAVIGPGFVDWNRFRGPIERQVSTATGRAVTIAGGIGFSLLPRPALAVRDLRLANAAGATEPVMLSVQRLEAQLNPLALLAGKIQITDFRLQSPVLHLEAMAGGRNNWSLLDSPDIRLDDVRLDDATLTWRDARSGAALRFDKIEAHLAAGSLQGPFKLTVALRAQGAPVKLTAEIGALGLTTPALLMISGDAGALKFNFNGSLAQAGLNGKLRLQGADLAQAIVDGARVLARDIALLANLAKPFEFETGVQASGGVAQFSDARLQVAGGLVSARARLEYAQAMAFDAEIAAASLDLDALLAGSAPFDPAALAFDIPETLTGSLRLNMASVTLNQGRLRDVKLALSLDAGEITVQELGAQLPGTSVAQIDGKLASAAGKPRFTGSAQVQSENFRALLAWAGADLSDVPKGRLARMRARVQLDATPQRVQALAIEAQADSTSLSGAAAVGLGARPSVEVDLQIDQLNADAYLPATAKPAPVSAILTRLAGLDSHFNLNLDALSYRGVAMSGIKASGEWAGGELTLNSFSIGNVADTALEISGALANISTGPQGEITVRLASKDVSGLARLLLAPPVGRNLGAAELQSRWLFAGQRLDATVDGKLGETTIKFSGQALGVAQLFTDAAFDPRSMHATLDLDNQSLAGFATQLNLRAIAPVDAAADAPVAIRAEVTGDLDAVEASATADIAGATVILSGDLANASASREFTLSAEARGDDLNRSLRGLGLDFRPNGANLGGFAVSAGLAGNRDSVTLGDLNGTIGPISLSGEGRLALDGDRPMFHVKLSSSELLVDQWLPPRLKTDAAKQLPWSGDPLDFAMLDRFDAEIEWRAPLISWRGIAVTEAKLLLGVQQGIAEVREFTGSLFGGPMQAQAGLGGGAAAPEFTARIALADADSAAASAALFGERVLSGRFDLSGVVKGAGASSFAIVSNLEGVGKFTIIDGAVHGIDLPGLSKQLKQVEEISDLLVLTQNAFAAGQTGITRLDLPFTISHGVLRSGAVLMQIEAASGGLELGIDLPRYWLDAESQLALKDHALAPGIGVGFSGPLNNPARRLRTQPLESYFTGQLVSKGLERMLEAGKTETTPPAANSGQPAPEKK